MRGRLVLLLSTMLCLSACAAFRGVAGGGVQSPPPSETPSPVASPAATGLIPWNDTKPNGFHQGLATPFGDGVPRLCKAEELTAAYGGAMGATNGQLEGLVNFVNRSQSPCTLRGVPMIHLADGDTVIPTIAWTNTRFAMTPVILEPRPFSPPDKFQGVQFGDAFVAIDWSLNDPGVGTCVQARATASVIRIDIPGDGGSILVPAATPRNDGPLTFCPPRIGVGAFQAAAPAAGSSPTRAVAQRFWSATLMAPSVVRAGQRLEYAVTLTNVFYRALAFRDGCPSYIEALAGPGSWTTGKEWFVLNCAGMGVIQPGATVRLAMAIDVPATAPLGKSSLVWELDNGQTSWGASMADVTITPN